MSHAKPNIIYDDNNPSMYRNIDTGDINALHFVTST